MDRRDSGPDPGRRPYWKVLVSLAFSIASTILFVGLLLYGIGFFMPFVVGWAISAIAHPIVVWLEKRLKMKKKLGSALIAIFVLGLVILVLYAGISRLILEISSLLRNAPQIYGQVEEAIRSLSGDLSGLTNRLPLSVQDGIGTFFVNLEGSAGKLISNLSEPTFAAAGNFAKRVPSYLIALIVAILSSYFFTVDKEKILIWLKRVFPSSVTRRMTLVTDNLKYAVGGYFKAQFKIMGIVFAILLVGFGVLGVRYFVLIALLVAFLDFLPFFGTGTAVIPWAVYCLLTGKYKMAAALVVLYIVTQLARHLLQPKLVGDSMGLHPIVTLLLLYGGYRLWGMWGMILSVPVGLVFINMLQAGAFDYILDDVRVLVEGILKLRE